MMPENVIMHNTIAEHKNRWELSIFKFKNKVKYITNQMKLDKN